MIRNYFMVALRNLTKHKFFSAINIFGLSISMSVCLGIIMLVADQLNYDRHNSKSERIFRVNTRYLDSQGVPTGNDYSTTPLPVATSLKEDFTGVEKAVRIRRGFGNGWIEFDQDVSVPIGGFYVDPEALDIFEHELKFGNPATALVEPYSVVLTEKAAKKLFSQENPVGELIKVGKLGEYKVTGVIKEKSAKSHIIFEALASFSTIKSLEAQKLMSPEDVGWENFTSGWVYLLLDEKTSPQVIEKHLDKISRTHKPNKHMGTEDRSYSFFLQNLCAITPGPFINNPIGPFMPRIFVYFFGGLALIVMLTSCFNYTNLSIARSLTRAKEIGVRKVNGANRFQIFSQFLSESIILSLIALFCSIVLLILVKPFILNLRFAQILKWDLEGNFSVYGVFILFSIVAGILAGFFPSVILSRFEPMKVLRKAGSIKLFSRITLRKSLLVIQFALSLIFIVSVILLHNQLSLFIRADHGFDMSSKFSIRLNNTSYTSLREELSRHSNIVNVSAASHIPAAGTTYGDGVKHQLSDQDFITLDYYNVDENYLDNMSLKLVAGKNFDGAAGASNKNFLLINEQAVQALNMKTAYDALGKVVYGSQDSARFEIIGVVKDYNHQVLIDKIAPMALKYNPEGFNILQVKYGGSPQEAAKVIENAWAKVNPNQKIDYKDFEEEVRGFYKTVFSDFVSIVGVISFMAIVVSCLGLLGMATYATEVRTKEISIRKVLGSSSTDLVFLLSKGFLLLLGMAVIIALPIAWFVNNLWLELIAYRTSFNLETIVVAVSALIILGTITIGSQTLRAAFSNPAQALKND